MTLLIGLIVWTVGLNTILLIESMSNYRNIGWFTIPKLILLLILWPIVYPTVVLSGSWRK